MWSSRDGQDDLRPSAMIRVLEDDWNQRRFEPCATSDSSRGERVIISPLTLRRWFNGFCATRISREFRVAQKPLDHWDKPSGEKVTGSER